MRSEECKREEDRTTMMETKHSYRKFSLDLFYSERNSEKYTSKQLVNKDGSSRPTNSQ